ncbi:MAG: hypothetical protein NT062_38695 [Proteobacteria bacterium]|nr:hypothetical protein [Pseudomonadota bacterium]
MRNLPFAVAVAAAGALVLAACGKGDPQKCDAACRNYATLQYWELADAEIARTAPDKREAVKRQKVIDLAAKLEVGLDFCVSKCEAANNDDQTKCLIDAKTAGQVKACTVAE